MPKRIDRHTRLTELETELLLTGSGWLALAGTWSEDEMRQTWHQCSRELMREWFSDPERLFSRPYGWWRYAAPEPRRRTGGEGIAAIESPDCSEWAKKFSYGIPCVWDDDYDDETEDWYETEKEYLLRHPNLLVPEERRALKAERRKTDPKDLAPDWPDAPASKQ